MMKGSGDISELVLKSEGDLRILEPHRILDCLSNNYAPLRRRPKGWLLQLQLWRSMLAYNANKMPTVIE